MNGLNKWMLALVGSFLILTLVPSISAAQTSRPKPPLLCIYGSADCEFRSDSQPGPVKWHPGHYVRVQGGGHCLTDQDEYFAGVQRNLNNQVPRSDKLLGAYVIYGWGLLEPEQGVYDWSRVYENLNWLAERGKYLIVALEHKCYGGVTDPEWAVPRNLENQVELQEAGNIAAIWREDVMTQYIDFVRAFAAEFDTNPNIEMVSIIPESCPGFHPVPRPADYSISGYSRQLQRLFDDAADTFKDTVVAPGVNCSMAGEVVDLVENLYQNGLGRSAPDAHELAGYRTFAGEFDGAIRDYRGLLPHRVIVSAGNLGGDFDRLPLSRIQSLIDNGSVTHAVWVLTSRAEGGTMADIISHIETPGNDTYQACPSRLEELRGGCR